jgi:hypothetical protein
LDLTCWPGGVLSLIELRGWWSGGSAAARPRIPTTRCGQIARTVCPRASSRSRYGFSTFICLSVFYFILYLSILIMVWRCL